MTDPLMQARSALEKIAQRESLCPELTAAEALAAIESALSAPAAAAPEPVAFDLLSHIRRHRHSRRAPRGTSS
jgi:hypothetical protein